MNDYFKTSSKGINPTLEFVKSICFVLNLDPAVRDTVTHLKNNLLRFIGNLRSSFIKIISLNFF